jgi:hypothetical protein
VFIIYYITGPSNISGPSFPGQKKRRALRVHKTIKKTTQPQNHVEKAPVPEKQTRDVFDRLSRLSTISFSNKVQQQNSFEKEKKATSQSKLQQPSYLITQETEQYQLDSSMPIKSVAERIARFENSLFPRKRLKSKITNSFISHQKKTHNSTNIQTSSAQIPEHLHAHRQTSPVKDSSTSSKYPSIEHSIDKSHQLPSEQPPSVTKRRSLYNELQASRRETVDKTKQGGLSPQLTPSIVPSINEQIQENEQHSDKSFDGFFDIFIQSKLDGPRASHASDVQNKTHVIKDEKRDEATRSFFNDLKKPNQQKSKQNSVPSLLNEPKEKKQGNQDQSTHKFFDSLLKSNQQKPKSHPVRNYSQINERIEAVREEIRIASRPIQVYTDEPFTPSKKRHHVPDSTYFIDERIKRARQVLKASKERTQKWMKELSVNQATKPTQHNIVNEKQRKTK